MAGVTAVAGPFAEVTVQTEQGGQPFGQLTLVGRSAPGGPVDDLVLSAGRWPDGPGQVVLNTGPGGKWEGPGTPVGSALTVTGMPGNPSLTVVGLANSITNTAAGWVAPGEIAALRAPGTAPAFEMLYRFTSAGGYAQVRDRHRGGEPGAAGRRGRRAPVPGWPRRTPRRATGPIMEPFVVAFALIGLIMAVLIVGNVISGAVIAGYHRIGVLKSIGLSPQPRWWSST